MAIVTMIGEFTKERRIRKLTQKIGNAEAQYVEASIARRKADAFLKEAGDHLISIKKLHESERERVNARGK